MLEVVLGKYNLVVEEETEQVVNISDWINHPDFKQIAKGIYLAKGVPDNDLAIIKLASRVSFSYHVLPVCLPSSSKNYEGVSATVSGFGRTSCNGTHENKLQKVTF